MNDLLDKLINQALQTAKNLEYEVLIVDHLAYVLLESPEIQDFFAQHGIDPESLQKDLLINLRNNKENINNSIPSSPHDFFRKAMKQQPAPPPLDPLLMDIIKIIILQTQERGLNPSTFDVLFFVLQKGGNGTILGQMLEKNGHNLKDLINNIKKFKYDQAPVGNGENIPYKKNQYLTNLNELAKQKKLDPIIGREKEIDRMVEVLLRRSKNNPVLVGEPGVGKTALALGLANKIVNKEVPEDLQEAIVFSLDIGALVAGTKYRGEFEDRLKKVIAEVKQEKKGILYCDEIHNIIGAGSAQGTMDAANLLKPELASGDLRCIGATTYKEFRNIIEKDPALTRRFRKIDIKEPSNEDTIKILMGLKNQYEEHHKTSYSVEAIEKAVELAGKYITGKFNPDKSLDLIDEAGSFARKNNLKEITPDVIEEIVAKIANVPKKTVISDYSKKVQNLRQNLKFMIYGQDDAIDQAVKAIELNHSGLGDEKKPIGSFLFVGPTGVGKTELVNQLAENLGVPLTRIDMSEFSEKHTVSKLVGAPPGYVGYDQEGQLTEAVIKNPHSIILLDEIEKAHPEIYNILLQVFDYGTLRDSNNRIANFKNAIIVMTSNIGAKEASRRKLGISQDSDLEIYQKPTEAIKNEFSPEFLNRLDAVIHFKPLSKESIDLVFEKNIDLLNLKLKDKNIDLEITSKAKDFLVDKGYDVYMGARPMARVIKEYIKEPLSEKILYTSLKNGGKVLVDIDKNNHIKLKVSKSEKPSNKKKEAKI